MVVALAVRSRPGSIGHAKGYCDSPKPIAPTMPSSSTMSKLRHLSSASNLVLFTPVVIPLGASHDRSKSVDPFEIFGRRLSLEHKRIRHVPYVPSAGFTNTHAVLLDQASAMVVVICQPATSSSGKTGNGVSKQLEFVEKAATHLAGKKDRGNDVVKVIVQFGEGKFRPDDIPFETVLHDAQFDAETMERMVKQMFERRG